MSKINNDDKTDVKTSEIKIFIRNYLKLCLNWSKIGRIERRLCG